MEYFGCTGKLEDSINTLYVTQHAKTVNAEPLKRETIS